MPAEQHGRKQNPRSGLQVGNVFATLCNFSGDIATEDVREFDARKTLTYPEIKMVQGASANPDEDVILAELRIRGIFVTKNFGTTKFMDANGFHGWLLRKATMNSSKC
jgi:hypothetical protein